VSVVYGPVPSWRLGRSLGIDLLPGRVKTCCFDCVYCQLGTTGQYRVERATFVSLDDLGRELSSIKAVVADVVTFSGTGEPTLAKNLGPAIELARRELGLPVVVLTNSALISREDVRQDLAKADIVVAKLDASDEKLFRAVNRPANGLSLADVVDGLRRFRSRWKGKLALQMMFVAGNKDAAGEMAVIARELAADEVQLNTPLRPCAVSPLPEEELTAVRDHFRDADGVITVHDHPPPDVKPLDVVQTLLRRPASGGERARA
jgi:wyosine [tRNA(Phe)-imidazoG37] synthetase (radical SAM superfamily)